MVAHARSFFSPNDAGAKPGNLTILQPRGRGGTQVIRGIGDVCAVE